MALQRESLPVDPAFQKSPRAWLGRLGGPGVDYLLAHADDGVLWGRVDNGSLRLAGDEFPEVAVDLRPPTLQKARLFGPAGEILVWRTPTGFSACRITDPPGGVEGNDWLDEDHLLWGSQEGAPRNGFILLREGRQGFLHAPPLDSLPRGLRAVLRVRHALERDQDTGRVRLAEGRLVAVTTSRNQESTP